jgi:kynurenine formamidase
MAGVDSTCGAGGIYYNIDFRYEGNMKVIDASGRIYEGMWGYGPPFPDFKLVDIKLPDWVDYESYSQAFEGFHMLTGTYMVMPSHGLGLDSAYAVHDIPISSLYNIDAYVLKFDLKNLQKEGPNPFVSYNDIIKAQDSEIPQNAAILFATGWGSHWGKPDYLKKYWFLKKDAYEYILSKKPFLIGLDSPAMDNMNNPQGLSKTFYSQNIIMIAPLVNLEHITGFKVKLSVSPLNVMNTTGAPCRVVVTEL